MSTATTPAGTKGTALQTLINVFVSPREAFTALDAQPRWVLPCIIILIVSIITAFTVVPVALQDPIAQQKMEEQRDKMIEQQGMTPQEADRAMELGVKIQKIAIPIVTPIGTVLMLVIISAILLFIGNILLGGKANFKKVFSMYTHSALIGVLGSLVAIFVALSKHTTDVPLNLAYFLVPDDKGSFLYNLLSNVELFRIWQLVVVIIGMAVIYKFTTKKVAYAVVGAYVLIAVLFSALGAAFA